MKQLNMVAVLLNKYEFIHTHRNGHFPGKPGKGGSSLGAQSLILSVLMGPAETLHTFLLK